jgi:hypothetical protein
VDPRASLDAAEKIKFLTLLGLELQPSASRYTDLIGNRTRDLPACSTLAREDRKQTRSHNYSLCSVNTVRTPRGTGPRFDSL